MAKKNSTKTATKEALQSAEPRLQVFTGWQGINIKDAPLKWSPLEYSHPGDRAENRASYHQHKTTDLKPNYLMVQNNLVTDDSGTIQTRLDSRMVGICPDGGKFTGIVHVHDRWIFCAVRYPFGSVPGIPEEYLKDTGGNRITSNFLPGEQGAPSTVFDQIRQAANSYKFVERILYAELPGPRWDAQPIPKTGWTQIILCDSELGYDPPDYEIREIAVYENRLIVTTRHEDDSSGQSSSNKAIGEIFTGIYTENWKTNVSYESGVKRVEKGFTVKTRLPESGAPMMSNVISSPVKIKDPVTAPTIVPHGITELQENDSKVLERIEVCYIYLNDYGMTLASKVSFKYFDWIAVAYSADKFISIEGTLPTPNNNNGWTDEMLDSITGVDVYLSTNHEQNKAFAGHVDIPRPGTRVDGVLHEHNRGYKWKVNYLGSLDNVEDWDLRDHDLPLENSTKGVPAAHFAIHDSRLYFWGNPDKPYRLYIGGAPGAELSVARGYGGAWIDIEPGSGLVVQGTAKWKTASGANIITIMCGNPNTGMVKRFNLVETNLVLSNEVSAKGYMYEEVSNVVGCNSRWGYGVYDDGLYSVSRYGLTITTMAMEYNNQMRSQNVSDVIQPVFTDRMGTRLKDCRMVCIDSIIYLCLHQVAGSKLDQVILVYDIEKKSWYTFTHDETIVHTMPNKDEYYIPTNVSEDTDRIEHIFEIDSDEKPEGLGVITDGYIWLYPTAGRDQNRVKPAFEVLVETGELATRMPIQSFHWLHQLELRFDYFIGTAQVIVEGTDYYGRPFRIEKTLNKAKAATGDDNDFPESWYREYTEHIMVGMLVQSYHVRIKGQARFRLVSMIAKVYMQSNRIATMYGWDDLSAYANRHGGEDIDHHYVESYNNLIRGYDDLMDAIVT